MRTHAFTLVLLYIYGLVALLDNTQLSFSIITILILKIGLFDLIFEYICWPCSCLSYYSLRSSLHYIIIE